MANSLPNVDVIHIQRVIPAKRWRVLRTIARVQNFKDYMPNVKQSEVLEKKDGRALTQWNVNVDGLPIKWKQEDWFDGKTFTLHFKAVEGDLQVFEGEWVLRKGAEPGTTNIYLEVRIHLGIPIFDEVVKPMLISRLQKNFETMLDSVENVLLDQRYTRVDGEFTSVNKLEGFVVMGHPYNFQHLLRIFKVFKPDIMNITPEFLMKIFELAPAYKSSDIKNYRSKTGKTVNGYFVMCPIIPDMALLSPEIVLPKVLEGCRIAERLGAGVLALGGFTSIVGEKYFDQLKSKIKIPITTGNAFTAAMALSGVRKACNLLGISLRHAKATIIGGTGDIGSACSRVLAREVSHLTVTGRTPSSLKAIEAQLKKDGGAHIETSLDNNEAVKQADIIIAAASSAQSIVDINVIKPGAVVCDVGYPKNISYSMQHRDDILVFSGGLASIPSPFNLGFEVGLPSPNVLYGCFSEAIILALEGRYENFSEGKGKLTPEKIAEIDRLADKHGFSPAPFFWGNQLMNEAQIKAIQQKARV